jgi:hypothetical protein
MLKQMVHTVNTALLRVQNSGNKTEQAEKIE